MENEKSFIVPYRRFANTMLDRQEWKKVSFISHLFEIFASVNDELLRQTKNPFN